LLKHLKLSGARILYSYSSSPKRVQFYFALKGRGKNQGILKQTNSEFISKGALLVKPQFEQAIDDFLRTWKCKFSKKYLAKPIQLQKIEGIEDLREIAGKLVYITDKKLEGKYALSSKELFKNQKLFKKFSEAPSLLARKSATHSLFTYSTSHLSKTDRVKFFYALKGRTSPGILKQTKSEFLARGVILTPTASAEKIENFLRKWKCRVTKVEVSQNAH